MVGGYIMADFSFLTSEGVTGSEKAAKVKEIYDNAKDKKVVFANGAGTPITVEITLSDGTYTVRFPDKVYTVNALSGATVGYDSCYEPCDAMKNINIMATGTTTSGASTVNNKLKASIKNAIDNNRILLLTGVKLGTHSSTTAIPVYGYIDSSTVEVYYGYFSLKSVNANYVIAEVGA